MSVTASQLVAEVKTTGVSAAKSDLDSMGSSTDSLGSKFKSVLGGVLGVAAVGAGAAIAGLSAFMISSVKDAMANQAVMAQTAQAIKSTGDASGMSAVGVSNLAESLSNVTDFSKDTVQGGENMLLTFTNIGKKVFPDATQAMLDMSQVTGQSLTGSAVQLGKALGDPITGISALSRVGVTFTQSQKDTIKAMVGVGNTAGAQEIILKELGKEFGGSAEAAGKTFGGQLKILQNNLENLKDKIGTAVLPMLQSFVSSLSQNVLPVVEKFADWFVKNGVPAIENFVTSVKTNLGGAATFVGQVFRTINISDFKNALHTVALEAGYLAQGFQSLVQKAKPTKDALEPIGNVIAAIIKAGLGTVTNLLWGLSGAFTSITRSAQQTNGPLQTIGSEFLKVATNMSPLSNLFQALSSHSSELARWFQTSVVAALKQAEPGFKNLGQAMVGLAPVVVKISDVVHNVFQTAFTALLPVIEKLIPLVIQISGYIANGLAVAIKFAAPIILQVVQVLGQFADQVMTRVTPILIKFIANIQSGLNTVMTIWHAVWPSLAPVLAGVWQMIQGIVKIAWSLISGIILVGLDLLSGNWKQAWTDIKNALAGAWSGIQTLVGGALATLKATFFNQIGALKNDALSWGGDIINAIVNGINGAISNVEGAANKVASTIKSILHFSLPDTGPLADADTYMPDFMTMLADGMNKNLGKVKAASLNVASSISIVPTASSLAGVGGAASGLNIIPQSVSSASNNALGGNNQQPIIMQIDGRQFARLLMPLISDQIRYNVAVKM